MKRLTGAAAARIRELVASAVEEHGQRGFARRSGVPERSLGRVLVDGRAIDFDLADTIIVRGLDEPDLWWHDPVLAPVYKEIA